MRTIHGDDLRAERVRQHLTQADLAARLNVSARRVSAVECSARVAPRFAARYMAALQGTDPATERLERAARELVAAAEAVE